MRCLGDWRYDQSEKTNTNYIEIVFNIVASKYTVSSKF